MNVFEFISRNRSGLFTESGGTGSGAGAGGSSSGTGSGAGSTAGATGSTGAGSGSTGAGSGQAASTGGAAAPAAGIQGASDWTTGLSEETRGYVQNKGWKDSGSLVDSYRGLEKMLGAGVEKLIKIPEGDNAAEFNTVFSKLGKPEKAEGYNIPAPKEGAPDKDFMGWAKNAFHNSNLTAKQAETLAGQWNEFAATTAKAQQDMAQAKLAEETKSLQKEWGAAHEQNTNVAKNAAKTFGVKAETIAKLEAQMGYAEVMKMFHSIGQGLGEDRFVGGAGGSKESFINTPEQAKSKLGGLMKDKVWSEKFLKGDRGAREEFDTLTRHSFPAEDATG